MTPRTVERNYAKEMRELIDERATGNYAAAVVAAELVAELSNKDPELLENWLYSNAGNLIRDLIMSRDKSRRGRNRARANENVESKSVFIQAVEAGDLEKIAALRAEYADQQTEFLKERYATADGSRVSLGEMNHDQRVWVADHYKETAASNLLQEAFLRAIDRKAGRKQTWEVFDEETLAKLWRSLSSG
jgi:hypothetical protein